MERPYRSARCAASSAPGRRAGAGPARGPGRRPPRAGRSATPWRQWRPAPRHTPSSAESAPAQSGRGAGSVARGAPNGADAPPPPLTPPWPGHGAAPEIGGEPEGGRSSAGPRCAHASCARVRAQVRQDQDRAIRPRRGQGVTRPPAARPACSIRTEATEPIAPTIRLVCARGQCCRCEPCAEAGGFRVGAHGGGGDRRRMAPQSGCPAWWPAAGRRRPGADRAR